MATEHDAQTEASGELAVLDLARAGAALWVLVAHVMVITGKSARFVADGSLAVDVFILISGFLMCLVLERDATPTRANVLRFYLRRYFRIAPAFYVAVFAYVCFRGFYADGLRAVEDRFGVGRPVSGYVVPVGWSDVSAHLAFAHGLVPGSATRIFGPAWTLSLEMQFYAVAPFLVYGLKRAPWPTFAAVMAANVVGDRLFGYYGTQGRIGDFGFPCLLPTRILLFALGSVACRWLTTRAPRELGLLAAALACCGLFRDRHSNLFCFALLGGLAWCMVSDSRTARWANWLMSAPVVKWAAEWSYGVY